MFGSGSASRSEGSAFASGSARRSEDSVFISGSARCSEGSVFVSGFDRRSEGRFLDRVPLGVAKSYSLRMSLDFYHMTNQGAPRKV